MGATVAKTNGRTRGPRVPMLAPTPAPEPEQQLSAPALTPNLDAAVLRVQAQARPLVRNATGQVQHRTYTYVTLAAVTDEVLPLLVAEELLWKVFPTALDEGRPGLRYRMTHVASGEYDEDTMPLPCDPTMQGLGSGLTYGRRYALTSYLNLTIDEDDDGAAANQSWGMAGPGATRPEAAPTPAPRPQATTGGRPASVKQRNLCKVRAKEAGLDAPRFANVILKAAGDESREWADEQAAERWLARALGRLQASMVDDVLAGIESDVPF